MSNPTYNSFREIIPLIIDELVKNYWQPMDEYLNNHPHLIHTAPGFLLDPQKIVLYFGRKHLGIEYIGSERIEILPEQIKISVQIFDSTQTDEDFFEQIVGFKFSDNTSKITLPLQLINEDLIMPTNAGADKLSELKWNFSAQDAILGFNLSGLEISENQFARIVNGLFFDANENGLKTRHIKWLDFIPIKYDEADDEHDILQINLSPYKQMVEQDCNYIYPLPEDFRLEKLQRINRFIELIGSSKVNEPEITQFLTKDENQFILTMRFCAESLHAEIPCEWQSETRKALRPDFFVLQPNGYADIVEFKLPTIKGKSVVGKENRETFSAEINSYISQTRTYRNYFEDPNNREWFSAIYGYKVLRPKRYLIIGRRWQFSSDEWKEIISDYHDIEIITYDDLVDGVVAQFYL